MWCVGADKSSISYYTPPSPLYKVLLHDIILTCQFHQWSFNLRRISSTTILSFPLLDELHPPCFRFAWTLSRKIPSCPSFLFKYDQGLNRRLQKQQNSNGWPLIYGRVALPLPWWLRLLTPTSCWEMGVVEGRRDLRAEWGPGSGGIYIPCIVVKHTFCVR